MNSKRTKKMSNKNFIIKVLLFLIFFIVYAATTSTTTSAVGCKYSDGTKCSSSCCATGSTCAATGGYGYKTCNTATGTWGTTLYSSSGCTGSCAAPFCGNGNCDSGSGETCSSCPGDCGVCTNDCGDDCYCDALSTCNSGYVDSGKTCPKNGVVGQCCCPVSVNTCNTAGHQACESAYGENCENCPADCGVCGGCTTGCSASCYCDVMDGCDGCGGDRTPTSSTCIGAFGATGTCCCLEGGSPAECGDGTCDTDLGENYENCCADCPCPLGENCVNGACVDSSPSCTSSCGSWTNQGCGGWTCDDEEMYQKRSCSISGCTTSRCIDSLSCWTEPDIGVCVPGETEPRQCGDTDVGECEYGTQTRTCNSQGQWGSYGSCVGAVYPTTEICDGKDNDCDSSIDEGVTQPCYTGPAGTNGVGICHSGIQTCTAGIWGSCVGEVTPQEEIYDGDDNDCDGYVDECVIGTVTNVSLELIKSAEIKILGLVLSDITDANGDYFICDLDLGTYDIGASKKGFNPDTKQFTFDGTTININFTLYTAGSDCRPDCSKTNDEIPVCHMDCEGINDCHFYDNTLRDICTRNGEMIGVPVGNTVSYNETHKATCCEGSPYFYKKTLGTSLVFPESENIIRITRIVFFRGQFARMIIDVFE